ncbi:MAG: rRNA pseudouridine synthase [Oscillospiraceae bacterium]|nr:rRNA pseudouridine synthase [Oscillospiraceae bacterium]
MRLDKYLSDCRAALRSETKELVKQGRITIDGIRAAKSSDKVSEASIVRIDGLRVEYKKYIYLMMNKPQGYVSATYDKNKPVVIDLLDEEYKRFEPFPAGRLDIDTEGLLILSNDGDFAHRLTSPKKNVYKRYFARLDFPAEKSAVGIFGGGMDLGDFTAKPAKLEICDDPREVFVEICEGKFHQVKRMFEKVGRKVVYLKRVKIGGLRLDDTLAPGEVRELSEAECEMFFR